MTKPEANTSGFVMTGTYPLGYTKNINILFDRPAICFKFCIFAYKM